jgi:methionyl aminopeptidase
MTTLYTTEDQRQRMRQAGQWAARALQLVRDSVRPGQSTADLDAIAEEFIRDNGFRPTFKGYLGFPGTLCTSVNHEIVHGIPSPKKILREGDIISVDVGVSIDADDTTYIGDNATTVPVGEISPKAQRLIDDTKAALEAGVAACRVGGKISAIAEAVESFARQHRYGLVKEFGGHGVGPEFHSSPFIPNYVDFFRDMPDTEIEPGMVLAIEPMLNLGLDDIRKLKDNWTIVTKDNKLSAHQEYSVLVLEDGIEIITKT